MYHKRNIREIDNLNPLVEYLKKNIAKGYKPEDLKWVLINQGHTRTEVDKAIKYVSELEQAQKPKTRNISTNNTSDMPRITEEKKGFFKKAWDFIIE